MPQVSIITPCYNASRFISQTIDSVLTQTFTDWEMIIVDDGSKDDSSDIVEKYVKKDSRIRLSNSRTAALQMRATMESEKQLAAILRF